MLIVQCGFVQVIQDDLLRQEIEMSRAHADKQIPLPLEHFQGYLMEMKLDEDSNDPSFSLSRAVSICMREMYHYARVSEVHVLECFMETALSAVKREQLQEASYVCVSFASKLNMRV